MVSSSTWNKQEAGCFSAVSYLVEKIIQWAKSFKAAPHTPLQMDPLPEDPVQIVEKRPLDVVSQSIDPVAILSQRNSALHARVSFVKKQLRPRADWIVFVPKNVQEQLKSSRLTCEKVYY